ncbi:MAG: transglycosylase family protein, partial [Acidimicrobiales bacterium]
QAAQAEQAAQAAQARRTAQAARQALAARTTRLTRRTPPAKRPVAAAPPTSDPGGVWLELRLCESGDNYTEDTGNGYYGAYQFALETWWGLGYSGLPSDAPPAVQDQAAERLQAEAGWGQWPACSADLGL